MTAARLQTIRNLIGHVPHVFASGGLKSNPSDNSDGSTSINWASGIPPSYAETEQDGGKRALVADLNCIGSLASRELYLWQHGGYHTFDMRVANLIGGYGFGAILDWWQEATGLMRKVRCIKEGGNCFTPIEDFEHGVESSDPHWQIVDMVGQSEFTMADVVETEIPDPYYKIIFGGVNALWLKMETFTPGNTYATNTWTAPDDVKIVADSMFTESSGAVRMRYNYVDMSLNESKPLQNLPNPFFLCVDGMDNIGNYTAAFGTFATLIVTPPDGAQPLSIGMQALSGVGEYEGNGTCLGPLYMTKGTTMKFLVPTTEDLLGEFGISFNFKFKAYKV